MHPNNTKAQIKSAHSMDDLIIKPRATGMCLHSRGNLIQIPSQPLLLTFDSISRESWARFVSCISLVHCCRLFTQMRARKRWPNILLQPLWIQGLVLKQVLWENFSCRRHSPVSLSCRKIKCVCVEKNMGFHKFIKTSEACLELFL